MKRIFSLATRVAGIAVLLGGSAFAQNPNFPGAPGGVGPAGGNPGVRPPAASNGPSAPPTGGALTQPGAGTSVAVIDIAYIFKNHAGFKAQMEGMKSEIEQYDAFIRGEQKKMTTERDSVVEQFKPNSPEFRKKEEELTRKQSEVQVQMAIKRREFLEKEAAIYYKTYNDLLSVIAKFSESNRIGIVLRFNGDDMDPQDRGSVLQGVNRAVVYQKNLDITEIILQMSSTSTARGPGPTPNPGPRPPATGPGAGSGPALRPNPTPGQQLR